MNKTLLSFLAVILLACVTSHIYGQSQPATEAKKPASDSINYLIAPFDKVTISVYGEPDLKSQQRVSDQGTVSIPLLGELKIGDLSVSDAQKHIQTSFIEARYLVKPVVTINVEEFAPKLITVSGEVTKPGSVTIPPGQNSLPIQVAIAQAGGFTGAAHKSEVTVKRKSGDTSKPEKIITIDVGNMLKADNKGNNQAFLVYPDDIIFIPRRLF